MDGFEQDPFASSKAEEAFSASTPDPFGSAFPPQNNSVSLCRRLLGKQAMVRLAHRRRSVK